MTQSANRARQKYKDDKRGRVIDYSPSFTPAENRIQSNGPELGRSPPTGKMANEGSKYKPTRLPNGITIVAPTSPPKSVSGVTTPTIPAYAPTVCEIQRSYRASPPKVARFSISANARNPSASASSSSFLRSIPVLILSRARRHPSFPLPESPPSKPDPIPKSPSTRYPSACAVFARNMAPTSAEILTAARMARALLACVRGIRTGMSPSIASPGPLGSSRSPLGAREAPHASRPSAREAAQPPAGLALRCARSAARFAPKRARRSTAACPEARRAH